MKEGVKRWGKKVGKGRAGGKKIRVEKKKVEEIARGGSEAMRKKRKKGEVVGPRG